MVQIKLLYTFGFLLAGLIYFSIGLLSYNYNKQNRFRRLFLMLCSTFAGWAIVTAFMNQSETAEQAAMFRNLGIWFFTFSYPLLIHFIMVFSQRFQRLTKNFFFLVLLYLPAEIAIITYYFLNPYLVSSLRPIAQGWTYNSVSYAGSFAQLYLPVFIALSFISALGLCLYLALRPGAMKRERISFFILASGIFFMALTGGFTDLILPMMGVASVPPLGMILNVIPVVLCFYFMNKYSFIIFNIDNMMANVLTGVDDGIILVDSSFRIIYMNDGFVSITGIGSYGYLKNLNLMDFLPVDCRHDKEHRFNKQELTLSKNGSPVYVMSTFSGLYDPFGDFLAGAYIIKDITSLREKQLQLEYVNQNLEDIVAERTEELQLQIKNRENAENEMRYLAYHDYLTSLFNRRAIIEQTGAILQTSGEKISHAFIFMDLNKFKEANDNLGHEAGDQLLINTAEKLKLLFKKSALLSRTGGDEFLVFLQNTDEAGLKAALAKIRSEFEIPVDVDGLMMKISLSCGASLYPTHGQDIDELIHQADMAMYKSKNDPLHRFYISGE